LCSIPGQDLFCDLPPPAFEEATVLGRYFSKQDVARMITNIEEAGGEGIAVAGEVLLHCSGQQKESIYLSPVETQQIVSSTSSRPQAAAAAMSQGQFLHTAGVLLVNPPRHTPAIGGNHWLAFQCELTSSRFSTSTTNSSSTCTRSSRMAVDTVRLTFYEPMMMSAGTVSSAATYNQGQLTFKYRSSIPSSYPPQRMVMLAEWHCKAWGCSDGTPVLIVVQETHQQHDHWSCGQWAVDNLAAIWESRAQPAAAATAAAAAAPVFEMQLVAVQQRVRWLMVAATTPGLLPADSCNPATKWLRSRSVAAAVAATASAANTAGAAGKAVGSAT
jgi:hypothetical protein